jgi:hypothetical protein
LKENTEGSGTESDHLAVQKVKAESDRKAKEEADQFAKQKAEEERVAIAKAESDQKVKGEADRNAKAKLIPAINTEMRAETRSAATTQKNQ